MSLNRPRRVAVVAAALSLAACAPGTPPESTAAEAATTPAAESTPAAIQAAATPAIDTATTLIAYQWQLTTATDGAGQTMPVFFPSQDKPLGLLVTDGRLNVIGSCNRISAPYRLLEGGQMQVSPGASTMMACPQPLADADAAMTKFLSGTLQSSIANEANAPQMRLVATDGSTLSFAGTPTPETRFGGPGARAFLEVSPNPCVAPAPTARPCLMVRDRQFDENGLASGSPGEWRALANGIEGYTLVDGEQQVVRVKRFEQAGTTGSTATAHFVFDMVVESRTVQ